jgi:uncharacterized protein (DUF2235 family)
MEFKKRYVINHAAPAKHRNVIVLMDGTWNDESGKDGNDIVTNIVKFYRILQPDSEHQISRYFRGVGNDEDNGVLGRLTQGAFGSGERNIREHAYATVCKEYQPGDRLFILGFSRGAATARMLASDLHKKGIPDAITIETKSHMNRSTRNIEQRFRRYASEGEQHPVNNIFLGVWDTVYAFGIPVKLLGIPFGKYNLFQDQFVSPNVDKAVHCVAVDETRDPFKPVLMNHDSERIHEVWFSGVHSDVGGGYKEDFLGRLTLNYMMKQIDLYCTDKNIPHINFQSDRRTIYTDTSSQKVVFHFHGLGWKKSIRSIHVQKDNEPNHQLPPLIHKSVIDHHKNSDTFSLSIKKRWFKDDINRLNRVVYNPPNIKSLKRKFTVVE